MTKSINKDSIILIIIQLVTHSMYKNYLSFENSVEKFERVYWPEF